MVSWLAGEAGMVLGQHYRHAIARHKVAYPVHPRTLQGNFALARICYLIQHLVPFSGGVLAKRF